MNQRREPRIEADQPIWITVFGEPDIKLPSRIKNVSVRGIGIELQGPIAIGAALRIDLPDALLLGEVIYCREDEASFYVGVELEHALWGLKDLAQVLGEFSEGHSGPEQTNPVKERRH